jgi:hypothetical protein
VEAGTSFGVGAGEEERPAVGVEVDAGVGADADVDVDTWASPGPAGYTVSRVEPAGADKPLEAAEGKDKVH